MVLGMLVIIEAPTVLGSVLKLLLLHLCAPEGGEEGQPGKTNARNPQLQLTLFGFKTLTVHGIRPFELRRLSKTIRDLHLKKTSKWLPRLQGTRKCMGTTVKVKQCAGNLGEKDVLLVILP